jgi:asparagine synthase (glutamine-hydrolysing)
MCGFFGHIKKQDDSRLSEAFAELKTKDFIKDRGPDEQNELSLPNAFFYHARLSLMGDFKAGKQPFRGLSPKPESEILLFNGSIYNYKLLNPAALSDTEVLFDLCQMAPIDVSSVNGAFCFSFYDPRKKKLKLFRDRIGIRPLFYVGLDSQGRIANGNLDEVIYSTNLVPIVEYLKARGIEPTRDLTAEKEYQRFRYVRQTSKTFFKGIKQLSPGHCLEWVAGGPAVERCYWSLENFHFNKEKKKALSHQQFTEEAHELLRDSIILRGESNTPISSFLSGGIDSGLITSVGLENGFIDKSFHLSLPGATNELQRLKDFLKLYPHQSDVIDFKTPTAKEFQDVMMRLEQPIGDSVVFLLDQLFRKSSKDYKIAMSGDGADEVFGGYVHHRLFQLVQLFHRIFPGILKESIINLMSKLPLEFFNFFFPYNDSIDQRGVKKLVTFLRNFSKPFAAYSYLVSLTDIENNDVALEGIQAHWQEMSDTDFSIEDLLAFDLKYWGPGYSLYKIDRLSFSHALEVRTPFYDHRVVELCVGQPFLSLRNIVNAKWNLQKSSRGLVSNQVLKQPKFPFRVKDHFLRGARSNLGEIDGGMLKGKQQTCLANYEYWKSGLADLKVL